jgi:hypothetical protein
MKHHVDRLAAPRRFAMALASFILTVPAIVHAQTLDRK